MIASNSLLARRAAPCRELEEYNEAEAEQVQADKNQRARM